MLLYFNTRKFYSKLHLNKKIYTKQKCYETAKKIVEKCLLQNTKSAMFHVSYC